MLADHLRLHMMRADLQLPSEVKTEAQGVEKGAAAQHAWVPGETPRKVRERIRRICHDEKQRLRHDRHDFRHDVAIDVSIGAQQLEAASRIAAVRRAAGLFVDAGRDDHEPGIRKVGIIAGAQPDGRRQRRAVLKIRDDAVGAFPIAVDDDDLASRPSHHQGEKRRRADRTRSDESHFHGDALLTVAMQQPSARTTATMGIQASRESAGPARTPAKIAPKA